MKARFLLAVLLSACSSAPREFGDPLEGSGGDTPEAMGGAGSAGKATVFASGGASGASSSSGGTAAQVGAGGALGGGGAAPACGVAEVESCSGPGGCVGQKACLGDLSGFGDCACPGIGGSPAGGAPGAGGSPPAGGAPSGGSGGENVGGSPSGYSTGTGAACFDGEVLVMKYSVNPGACARFTTPDPTRLAFEDSRNAPESCDLRTCFIEIAPVDGVEFWISLFVPANTTPLSTFQSARLSPDGSCPLEACPGS